MEQNLLSDVIKLMIRIDKSARKKFEQQLEHSESDKKKFEVDIRYFTDWFAA